MYSPINIGDSLNCTLKIRKRGIWAITLRYPFQNESERRLALSLSGDSAERAAKVPIEGRPYLLIKIVSSGENNTFSSKDFITPLGLESGDNGGYNSFLITKQLEEGSYQVSIDNLRNAPEFNKIKTKIIVREYFGK